MAKAQNGGETEVGSPLEQTGVGSAVEEKVVVSPDNRSEAGISGNSRKGSSSDLTPARHDRRSRAAQWQGPSQRSYHRNGRQSAGSEHRSASASTSGRQKERRELSLGRTDSGEDNRRAGSGKSFNSRRTEKTGGNGRGFEGRQSQKQEGGPRYFQGRGNQSGAGARGNAKYGWYERIEGKSGSQDSRPSEDREGGTATPLQVRAVLVTLPLLLAFELGSLPLLPPAGKPGQNEMPCLVSVHSQIWSCLPLALQIMLYRS